MCHFFFLERGGSEAIRKERECDLIIRCCLVDVLEWRGKSKGGGGNLFSIEYEIADTLDCSPAK